jgi:hypothetical protein
MLELKEDVTINKRSSQNLSYIIPVEQQNTRTYQCFFDKQTIFKDSLFYDISA